MAVVSTLLSVLGQFQTESFSTEQRYDDSLFFPIEHLNSRRLERAIYWQSESDTLKVERKNELYVRSGNEVGDQVFQEFVKEQEGEANHTPYLFLHYSHLLNPWFVYVHYDQPDHYTHRGTTHRRAQLEFQNSWDHPWEYRSWFGQNYTHYSRAKIGLERTFAKDTLGIHTYSGWEWRENDLDWSLTPINYYNNFITYDSEIYYFQNHWHREYLAYDFNFEDYQDLFRSTFSYGKDNWSLGLRAEGFFQKEERSTFLYPIVKLKSRANPLQAELELGGEKGEWTQKLKLNELFGLIPHRFGYQLEHKSKIYSPEWRIAQQSSVLLPWDASAIRFRSHEKFSLYWIWSPAYKLDLHSSLTGGAIYGAENFHIDSTWVTRDRTLRTGSIQYETELLPYFQYRLIGSHQYRQLIDNTFRLQYFLMDTKAPYLPPEWQLSYQLRFLLPSQLRVEVQSKWHSGYTINDHQTFYGSSDWTVDFGLVQYFAKRTVNFEARLLDLFANRENETINGNEHRFRIIFGGQWLF